MSLQRRRKKVAGASTPGSPAGQPGWGGSAKCAAPGRARHLQPSPERVIEIGQTDDRSIFARFQRADHLGGCIPGAARCALAPGYHLPRLRRCLAEVSITLALVAA